MTDIMEIKAIALSTVEDKIVKYGLVTKEKSCGIIIL
jgi:hypothetical protein